MDNNQSNSSRVLVRCKDPACSWSAQFVRSKKADHFRCNFDGTTNLQHSDQCLVVYHSRGLSPAAIAAIPGFNDIVQSNQNSPTKSLATAVSNQLALRVPTRTLQRARNEVLGNKVELAAEELVNIGALMAAFVQKNPRAVVNLEVNSSDELVHWFVAFDNSSLASGGVLPVLFCDGAHTKNTVCPRVILVISVLNTERQLVIVALACVKSESTESWTYMFTMFSRTALGILVLANPRYFVFMSDRDGGLLAAARAVFPQSILRYCILHVIKNAKKAGIRGNFRSLVKIAQAGSLVERNQLWSELHRSNPALVDWLSKSPIFAFQIQAAPLTELNIAIFGCYTNNVAESANSKMLKPLEGAQSLRQMPPGQMFRATLEMFSLQAAKFRDHAKRLSGFHSLYTRHAVQFFMKQQYESKFYDVRADGDSIYRVRRKGVFGCNRGKERRVWMQPNFLWRCDCCLLEQFRAMCRHILAVFGSMSDHQSHCRKLLKSGGVGDIWSKSDYVRAFGNLQVLVPSPSEEFACMEQNIFPRDVRIPPAVAQRGRPRKNRFISFTEGYSASARSRIAGPRAAACSICGQNGHNMRSCQLLNPTCDD